MRSRRSNNRSGGRAGGGGQWGVSGLGKWDGLWISGIGMGAEFSSPHLSFSLTLSPEPPFFTSNTNMNEIRWKDQLFFLFLLLFLL